MRRDSHYVFDTNTLVSALLFERSKPGQAFRRALRQGLEMYDIFQRADMTTLVQNAVGDDIELHYFPAQALESPDPASFAAYVLRYGLLIEETRGAIGDFLLAFPIRDYSEHP